MRARARASSLAALLLLVPAYRPLAAQDLTEALLLQRFLADNPQILALRAGIDSIRAQSRGRTLHPNPTIVYSREGAGLAEFFQFEQPLVLTARRRFLAQAAQAAESAASSDVERNVWELRSDLRTAFWRLVAVQERRSVLQGTIHEFEQVVHVLGRREAAGESSRFDLARVQRELLEAEIELTSNESELAKARGPIAAAVGAAAGPDLRAAGSLRELPPAPAAETLIQRALERRQDYLGLRAQLERHRNEGEAAARLRVPDPVITVGFKRGEGVPSTRHGSAIAVTVPLPLFDRGQAETARSQAEYERTRNLVEALGRRIRAEVFAAHAAFELRRSACGRYRTRLEPGETDLVGIAKVAYEEGEKTILDLLDVYRLSRHTELRRIELLAAAKEAAIDLERSVGEEVFP